MADRHEDTPDFSIGDDVGERTITLEANSVAIVRSALIDYLDQLEIECPEDVGDPDGYHAIVEALFKHFDDPKSFEQIAA